MFVRGKRMESRCGNRKSPTPNTIVVVAPFVTVNRYFYSANRASALFSHSSLRLQLREQDHVADGFLAEQHHAEAVDANAYATGGRHAVFEGDEKIFVELLLFAAGLVLQSLALL